MNFPGPIPKVRKHGRIKPKYNATPTARERDYHKWLMGEYPDCPCGCGRRATVVHHPLARHPKQRWRRDHEFVVPMYGDCHVALHAAGSEEDFQPGSDYPGWAAGFREVGILAGKLKERDDG